MSFYNMQARLERMSFAAPDAPKLTPSDRLRGLSQAATFAAISGIDMPNRPGSALRLSLGLEAMADVEREREASR